VVADVREQRLRDKESYKKHVAQMKKVGESLMGAEEQRSDYEEQPSIESSDKTRDEAYGASQHDKDMFIRYLIEQLNIVQSSGTPIVAAIEDFTEMY
jgi:hypothetical protein